MLCRLDDGAVEREFPAEQRIAGVTLARGDVWYTVDDPGLIVLADPETGKEVGRYDFAGTPTGLGWDGGPRRYGRYESDCLHLRHSRCRPFAARDATLKVTIDPLTRWNGLITP
jgi:hypothetical protein